MSDPVFGALSCLLSSLCLWLGSRLVLQLHRERRQQHGPVAGEETAMLVIGWVLTLFCAVVLAMSLGATYVALAR